jgi:D-beta-D-heptose 7-phosphate kinase/D-beta-D-heptose 1-phosphate adenosyltransferase
MTPDLSHVIDRFSTCRILCIGDVMLDKFVYGQVERISPEAPIPVFSIKEERAMLGGAGNVARNLVALGATTSFVSVIGNDKVGREIASMIGKEPRVIPYLVTETGRISTTKIRYVAGTQQVLRADHEVQSSITEDTIRMLTDTIIEEMAAHDVILLSDYGKGVFTRSTLHTIIQAAKIQNKVIIVDPKSRDFSLYYGASYISPNLNELSNAAARELRTDKDIVDAACHLMAMYDIGAMLVTRSKDGMSLIEKSGAMHHISAKAQEVFDVSGAGDTAIATMALGIAAGLPPVDAAMLANTAAGIVVGRLGTAVVTAQELKMGLFVQESASGVHKIMPLQTALHQVEQWKREGKTIGFTNGCFDLMHSGHLTLLHRTKFHCDKLIVGLNSDASIKRLKGESRPVNEEMERAVLLASLAVVDMVVIFTEDTPLTLIETLKPAVLAKGADYQKHQVVGHEIVEAYGGKIVLVPIKEGYSTTNIIKKLA